MAIAFNKKDEQTISAEDLALKMKFEEPMQKDFNRLFKTIARDFESFYVSNGYILDLNVYNNDVVSILRNNYRKISKKFKQSIRSSFKQLERADAVIDNDINQYINTHSIAQAGFIINTTRKGLQEDLDKTVIKNALDGIDISNEELAEETRKEFTERSLNRTEGIAVTETQNIAEFSKQTEQDTLIEEGVILGGIVLRDKLWKIWITFLTEVTRKSHILAHRQRRRSNEPFNVQNQLLMFPGDTSLGATADNIMNCKCNKVARVFRD
jgi:hypothetical protein